MVKNKSSYDNGAFTGKAKLSLCFITDTILNVGPVDASRQALFTSAPRVKRPGRKAEHSPPSGAEVKTK
jgi:hypothetical protein